MRTLQFSIAKGGNSSGENEDRYYVSSISNVGEIAHFVLSDGATEAAFSREWADTLANSDHWRLVVKRSTCDAPSDLKDALAGWLELVRGRFATNVGERSLPWYAKAKMSREGAFATFLGVRLTQGRGRRNWSAMACGDSCVFHITGREIKTSFPIELAVEFGNRPSLVSSQHDRGLPEMFFRSNTEWTPGDIFVLATDALAIWLLGNDSDQRLASLLQCNTELDFANLVTEERITRRMKNDDTTALIFYS